MATRNRSAKKKAAEKSNDELDNLDSSKSIQSKKSLKSREREEGRQAWEDEETIPLAENEIEEEEDIPGL